MEGLKSFLKSHLAVIIGLAAAFAAGWFLRPERVKIVTSEKTIEVRQKTETFQQKVDLSEIKQLIAEQAQKKNVVTIREIIKAPDGTTTTKIRIEDKTETNTKSKSDSKLASETNTAATKTEYITKTVEKYTLVEKLVRPDWSASVAAGFYLPTLGGAQSPPNYLPGLPSRIVVQTALERRLLGSMYGGVWVSSRLDAGIQVRVNF